MEANLYNEYILNYFKIHGGGNYFTLCREGKWAAVNISKNAITSIKSFILQKRGLPELPHFTVHRMIGNYEGYYGVPVSKMKEFEEKNGTYVKFAVVRNPMKRLLSVYDLFWMQGLPHPAFDAMKKNGVLTFSQFLKCVEEVLKAPLDLQDVHIRKQKDYFNYDDVDYIVDIGCLTDFMRNVLHEDFNVRRNVTDKHYIPTIQELNKAYTLYKDDIDFINNIPEEKHIQKKENVNGTNNQSTGS